MQSLEERGNSRLLFPFWAYSNSLKMYVYIVDCRRNAYYTENGEKFSSKDLLMEEER